MIKGKKVHENLQFLNFSLKEAYVLQQNSNKFILTFISLYKQFL